MASDVRLSNLWKSYGETVAVKDFSLHVRAGEFFSLVGPSGCGKTTILRMIAGFETPDEGTIQFGDREMTEVPANERNSGMVFQNYALFPHMTVGENTAFGLRARHLPKDEIAAKTQAALAMVQLAGLENRAVQELSGGQQQRVALARALVIRPNVLLLDEPLSNLDAKLRTETRAQLRHLVHESGITTVYVTHDQEEALALSDRLAVLRDGTIQQIGTPVDVYLTPVNGFVARFMGHTNLLEGRIIESDRRSCTVAIEGTSRTIIGPPIPYHSGDAVSVVLRPESLQIEDSLTSPSRHGNRWETAIIATEFRGAFTAYTIRLFETNLFVYRITRGNQLLQGDITVSIPPDQVVILPNE
ncbi:MAG TPA: ABC transporter ATP-binding protein [bacterium]|nr:ABC transporter ATP-binding protein [bacterium]